MIEVHAKPAASAEPESVTLLGCRFHCVTLAETVDQIAAWIVAGRRGWLCTVNVAILMMLRSDAGLAGFVRRASFVVADGQPLVWMSRMKSRRLPCRVAGVELVGELCARAARDGFGVYLLGAKREIVDEVARRLLADHPGLDLRGVDDGYFTREQAAGRAQRVADSGAKLLFVGMGVPRQEEFLEEHWDALGVSMAIPVGGSFDVLSGLRSRAPQWMQTVGLEWAFRLAQEPGRLWKRYLVTNVQFICLAGRELLFGERPRARAEGDS